MPEQRLISCSDSGNYATRPSPCHPCNSQLSGLSRQITLKGLKVGSLFAKKLAHHFFSLRQLLIVLASMTVLSPVMAAGLCEGLTTHKKPMVIPRVAKPPYGKYFYEPAFRTKVMRITKAKKDEVFKPLYSTVQAWNADESFMLLYRTGTSKQGHYLLNGQNYEIIKRLDLFPSDLEDLFWSRRDPKTLFYSSKAAREYGRLYSYNVVNGKRRLIKDFSSICKGSLALPGGDVHMQSLDDDLFGFRCRDLKSKNKKHTAFTYRVSTDETHIMDLGDDTPWHNWTAPMPLPSGDNVYLQGTTMTADLNEVLLRHDMAKPGEHGNIGLNYKGEDALFQVAFNASPKGCNRDPDKGVAHLAEYNLQTGKCRTIISEDRGYPYTTSATHISAQAYKRPGWVALSSVGYRKQLKHLKGKSKATPLFSEIYLVNTDPKAIEVCRLAHHRSTGKLAENGDYRAYFGEPHVSISPSGTRVLFGSDWYDSGSVDTYVIELSEFKRKLISAAQ